MLTHCVVLLDHITGVELRVPRDLVVDTEVTVIARYTTAYSSVSTGLITFYWDFGDGEVNSTTSSFTHTFSAPGNYTISLRADNYFSMSRVFKDVFVLGMLCSQGGWG